MEVLESTLSDVRHPTVQPLGREEDTLAKAQILVVEDERIVALDIKSQLKGLGYTVPAVVSRGEEAILKAMETHPDLVLMDVQLQGEIDGIEAAERIQAYLDIPVIYLTAHADDNTIERAKLTESFGYILKPFEERELHIAIEMALYKHRMERKLKGSERWLAAVLKSIGDAVIATDARGRIEFMNPVAQALTGWKETEALGQDLNRVFAIVDTETRAPIENPVRRALSEGAVVGLESHVLLISRDGRETPIDDSAAPIQDHEGNISGVVLVFRDVTSRYQVQEKLRQYAARLEASNEELDAFAHTVAHDLKDPLSVIIGCSSVLEEDYATMSDQQRQSFLRIIARVGNQTCNIIDELLLLAAMRDSDVQVEPIYMKGVVAKAQQRLAHMKAEYQAEITLPEEWPIPLGYGPWIEEVWVNYISNAIKYGGRPPHLELGATEQMDGTIRFWIRDNGPGIAPEDQTRLFSRFTRLGQVRATGHGLGLSIVRRIVEKLGGQVGVESLVGQGSTFSFTLPKA